MSDQKPIKQLLAEKDAEIGRLSRQFYAPPAIIIDDAVNKATAELQRELRQERGKVAVEVSEIIQLKEALFTVKTIAEAIDGENSKRDTNFQAGEIVRLCERFLKP